MIESTFRRNVLRALRPWHPVAVENPACPGTPDVNYADGWLELKVAKRPTATFRKPLTPQQRVWFARRVRAGGRAYVLVAFEDSALYVAALFKGAEARTLVRASDANALALFESWEDLRNRLPIALGLQYVEES